MSRLIYSFGKVYKNNGLLKDIFLKMYYRVFVQCFYIYLKNNNNNELFICVVRVFLEYIVYCIFSFKLQMLYDIC